jgi:hypothetical protein
MLITVLPELRMPPAAADQGQQYTPASCHLCMKRAQFPGQDLENPLDNWLLKRSADGFFALKETV